MFHQGTLQSGITLAIQQQKFVACFVRDDSATSKQWEEEWLKSGWVSSLLEQKAVLLRIYAGSAEAGFLGAFCDIPNIPTLVFIQNGQLHVQLKSDATENEFTNAVRKVLGAPPIPGSSAAQTPPPQANFTGPSPPIASTDAEDDLYGPSETLPAPIASTRASNTTTSSNAKGKQKATPISDAQAAHTVTAVQQAARDALRKKKREEAEELARIKARIEQDKAARKALSEARKLEREREHKSEAESERPAQATASSRGSQAKTVNLQVRLFDGRTIRSTFPRTACLQDDVRKWVDEEFAKLPKDDPEINNKRLPPYYFRHILPPQPSRELSAGDESQTLGDIDLAPSATLVLVPVKGYTEAYSGGGTSVVGAATGLVGGAFGLLSSTVGYLGSMVGYGSAPAGGDSQTGSTTGSSQAQRSQQPSNADSANIRVRTLADQRAREPRDQQFYNGNQLDFESNKDDKDR
ncbi:hypothetical protein FB567DRAFT_534274 [Paraphoma chrysanthemicola]|uniref:UBX domain-containing protein 2 n=1 Tax=Paraphoma chrysanthemicola TaxID=798071 RepID=A0A8K0VVN3_9PLEO|nr:hypothetical protein FB567DRAFT_534274 [Paraphoma chrysanthemicola]